MYFNKTQVAAFRDRQQDAFVSKVVKMCGDNLPKQCAKMNNDELKNAVLSSIRAAEGAGLSWKSNLATTCLLDLNYGRSVLAEPEIKEHLALAATPDRVFRHLFVGKLAEVWVRLDESIF